MDDQLQPYFRLYMSAAAGDILNANLLRLGAGFQWFLTERQWGRGGAAISIAAKYNNLVKQVHKSPSGHWVAISLCAPFGFTIISVYASNSITERTKIWKELVVLVKPCIIVGDFNMVE